METHNSAFSTILFVLLSAKLCLLLSNPQVALGSSPFDSMKFVFSRFLEILMVYISSMAYSKGQPSPCSLFSKIQQTWHRAILTLVSVELYNSAWTSLFLLCKTMVAATDGNVSKVVLCALVVMVFWLVGPLLFAHSEIACKMSLVMSIVEGGYEGGMEAMKRGGEVVGRRKFQGFVLTVVMGMVERRLESSDPVGILLKFLVWFVYTGFYHDCKKHGKGRASLCVLKEF